MNNPSNRTKTNPLSTLSSTVAADTTVLTEWHLRLNPPPPSAQLSPWKLQLPTVIWKRPEKKKKKVPDSDFRSRFQPHSPRCSKQNQQTHSFKIHLGEKQTLPRVGGVRGGRSVGKTRPTLGIVNKCQTQTHTHIQTAQALGAAAKGHGEVTCCCWTAGFTSLSVALAAFPPNSWLCEGTNSYD